MVAATAGQMKYAKLAKRDGRQADHLPYLRHVHDKIIKTQQGFYMGVIRVNGLCFQTLDQSDLNLRYTGRNQTVVGLGSSRYALYGHVIRREIDPHIEGTFDNPFVEELDERYLSALGERRMFVNEIYLTVIRRPMQGKVGFFDSLVRQFRNVGADGEPEQEIIRELADTLDAIARDMGGYGARVLKVVKRDNGVFSEPCEFLSKLCNGVEEIPVALARMGLNEYLPQKRIFFAGNSVEIRGASGSKFGAMISVKEYPPFAGPGMLDRMLTLPHEFIITQSFSIADRSAALDHMNKVGRQVKGSDHAGTAVEAGVAEARDQLSTAQAVYGEHHLTVMPLVKDLRTLPRVVAEVGAELTAFNMAWVREDLNCEPAYWGQFPANFGYIARRAMISSKNFAAFFSAHNFPSGEKTGMPWKRPICLLETTSQTGFYLNFHEQSGLGHFSVIGPSGSGKTVALNFLLAQAMRIEPRPRCVFFDKDRGAEPFIRAMGGRYETLEAGQPTGFNPFQLPDTPDNRAFLVQLLSFMLRPADRPLNTIEQGVITDAIVSMYQHDVADRKISNLPELLKGRMAASGEGLDARIKPWLKNGEYGWLFTSDEDRLNWANPVAGFDMTKLLDNPTVRSAALLYIFYRVRETLTGDPVLIFLDEGWRLLDDLVFVDFIKDLLKTARKLNGVVGFGTQSAGDIVGSKISDTLVEQTATNLFFPNSKADEAAYRGKFAMSEKEFEWVRTTQPESRCFLIKRRNDSVVVRLNLGGMPDIIKVLSGTAASVMELDELRARVGDDPAQWLPIFCGWEVPDAHAA
jgi:type IV secretion system protein VirB4